VNRHGERQAHEHSARVGSDRAVDKFTNFRKFFYRGNTLRV
jgi:hypothetical protein